MLSAGAGGAAGEGPEKTVVGSKRRWVRHLGKWEQHLLRPQNMESVSLRKKDDLDGWLDGREY